MSSSFCPLSFCTSSTRASFDYCQASSLPRTSCDFQTFISAFILRFIFMYAMSFSSLWSFLSLVWQQSHFAPLSHSNFVCHFANVFFLLGPSFTHKILPLFSMEALNTNCAFFSSFFHSLTHQITETNKFFHFGPILCSRFSPSATACHV